MGFDEDWEEIIILLEKAESSRGEFGYLREILDLGFKEEEKKALTASYSKEYGNKKIVVEDTLIDRQKPFTRIKPDGVEIEVIIFEEGHIVKSEKFHWREKPTTLEVDE